MVVEDDVDSCEMLALMLRKNGNTVLTADTGQAALDLLDSDGPLDAVLVDLSLPDIPGLSLCQKLQARQPNISIVVVSGRTEPGVVNAARQLGVRDFLSKPVDMPTLLSTLTAITTP